MQLAAIHSFNPTHPPTRPRLPALPRQSQVRLTASADLTTLGSLSMRPPCPHHLHQSAVRHRRRVRLTPSRARYVIANPFFCPASAANQVGHASGQMAEKRQYTSHRKCAMLFLPCYNPAHVQSDLNIIMCRQQTHLAVTEASSQCALH